MVRNNCQKLLTSADSVELAASREADVSAADDAAADGAHKLETVFSPASSSPRNASAAAKQYGLLALLVEGAAWPLTVWLAAWFLLNPAFRFFHLFFKILIGRRTKTQNERYFLKLENKSNRGGRGGRRRERREELGEEAGRRTHHVTLAKSRR